MDQKKLDVKYTGGPKTVLYNFKVRGNDPYAAEEAEDKLGSFIRKYNENAEESVFELGAHLYNLDTDEDLGMIVAYVDHRDENLVEIDTDIAPYFVETK